MLLVLVLVLVLVLQLLVLLDTVTLTLYALKPAAATIVQFLIVLIPVLFLFLQLVLPIIPKRKMSSKKHHYQILFIFKYINGKDSFSFSYAVCAIRTQYEQYMKRTKLDIVELDPFHACSCSPPRFSTIIDISIMQCSLFVK